METKVKIDLDLRDYSEEVAEFIREVVENKDHLKKIKARDTLFNMGKSIFPQMVSLLNSENYEVRIEAAKIIQQMRTKESLYLFIRLLEDDDSAVRWIAARGLVLLGRDSIVPVLKAIIKRGKSHDFKSGAHYVLKNLFNEKERVEFKTLLISLLNFNYIGVIAQIEARKALRQLSSKRYDSSEEMNAELSGCLG